jgi:hypothetical protein
MTLEPPGGSTRSVRTPLDPVPGQPPDPMDWLDRAYSGCDGGRRPCPPRHCLPAPAPRYHTAPGHGDRSRIAHPRKELGHDRVDGAGRIHLDTRGRAIAP